MGVGYARPYGPSRDAPRAVAKKKALAHQSADRAGKGRILNEWVELTGWYRDDARAAARDVLTLKVGETPKQADADLWAGRDEGADEVLGSASGRPGSVSRRCCWCRCCWCRCCAAVQYFIGRRTPARPRVPSATTPQCCPTWGRDAVKWQACLNERRRLHHLPPTASTASPSRCSTRHPPGLTAASLARLPRPLGLELRGRRKRGANSVPVGPPNDMVATREPSLDASPVYRPELL